MGWTLFFVGCLAVVGYIILQTLQNPHRAPRSPKFPVRTPLTGKEKQRFDQWLAQPFTKDKIDTFFPQYPKKWKIISLPGCTLFQIHGQSNEKSDVLYLFQAKKTKDQLCLFSLLTQSYESNKVPINSSTIALLEENSDLAGESLMKYFRHTKRNFSCVLLPGGHLNDDPSNLFPIPMAWIGVCKQGQLCLRLTTTTTMETGKDSQSVTRNLRSALQELRKENEMVIDRSNEGMLLEATSYSTFYNRMMVANDWLFFLPLEKRLKEHREVQAMVQTSYRFSTINQHVIQGKETASTNVWVNCRKGESVDDVLWLIKNICLKYQVNVEVLIQEEPSSICSMRHPMFKRLKRTIEESFPSFGIARGTFPSSISLLPYLGFTSSILLFSPVYDDDDLSFQLESANTFYKNWLSNLNSNQNVASVVK